MEDFKMTKNYSQQKTIRLDDGNTVTAYKVKSDQNGNARWVVHFLDFDTDYNDPIFKANGFYKYRARWFGGGVVKSTSSIEYSVKDLYNKIKEGAKPMDKSQFIKNHILDNYEIENLKINVPTAGGAYDFVYSGELLLKTYEIENFLNELNVSYKEGKELEAYALTVAPHVDNLIN